MRQMTIKVTEADVISIESPVKRKPNVIDKQSYFACRVMSPTS